MMFSSFRLLFRFVVFVVSITPVFSQPGGVTDQRPLYNSSLVLVADANFTAKKMQLSILTGEQILRDPITIETATNYAVSAAVQQAVVGATQWVVNSAVSEAAGAYVPYIGLTYTAVSIMLQAASTQNVQYRHYYVIAPAAGSYVFNAWVPGDWTMPDSMIKIFSIDDFGAESQLYNYDQQVSTDRTVATRVNLPRGLCHIIVAIGTGSKLTHTAGNLQSVTLDNPVPVQFTVPRVPVVAQQIGLLNYLPAEGSSYTLSIPFVAPPTPSNVLDGSVSYSNIQAITAIFPPDSTDAYLRVDVWDPNDEEVLSQIGTWTYLNMKAAQVGTATINGTTGSWTITRLADYTTVTIVRGIYHVAP